MSFLSVKVSGDFACFTKPEAKVERVSYPIITPSAARGLMATIYWHPGIDWQVLRIKVLKPIKTFSIMRNELQEVSEDGCSIESRRTQRLTVGLRDVEYVIDVKPVASDGSLLDDHTYGKVMAITRERLERGSSYYKPYLGCREFPADVSLADGSEKPIDWTEDLGYFTYAIRKKGSKFVPEFVRAKIEKGIWRLEG